MPLTDGPIAEEEEVLLPLVGLDEDEDDEEEDEEEEGFCVTRVAGVRDRWRVMMRCAGRA
jgi:hypothetical protein